MKNQNDKNKSTYATHSFTVTAPKPKKDTTRSTVSTYGGDMRGGRK